MNTVALRHFAAPARKHTEHGAVVCTDYHPPRAPRGAPLCRHRLSVPRRAGAGAALPRVVGSAPAGR